MSEAKHSLGPWDYCWREDLLKFRIGSPLDGRMAVASTVNQYDRAEEEANARLIAAAPDLLAAAEAVEWVWVRNSFVEECPWCGGNRGFGHAETCIRQQAIRKAKGQA